MQRYFFTIHGWDRVENGDPDGTSLPDVAAALSYAEDKIRKLRKERGYNDLALMMIVTDEARQSVLSLPFFRAAKHRHLTAHRNNPRKHELRLTTERLGHSSWSFLLCGGIAMIGPIILHTVFLVSRIVAIGVCLVSFFSQERTN